MQFFLHCCQVCLILHSFSCSCNWTLFGRISKGFAILAVSVEHILEAISKACFEILAVSVEHILEAISKVCVILSLINTKLRHGLRSMHYTSWWRRHALNWPMLTHVKKRIIANFFNNTGINHLISITNLNTNSFALSYFGNNFKSVFWNLVSDHVWKRFQKCVLKSCLWPCLETISKACFEILSLTMFWNDFKSV
jgi:hypothetical protein